MPIGPNGEKRPAHTVGCAVMVAKIAHRGDRGGARGETPW